MSTANAKNTITRTVNQGSVFASAINVISSALSMNQGDLIVFDASAHLLKTPTIEGDGSTFLGVMTETIVNGKLQKPYVTPVDGSQAITDIPGPAFGVIARALLKPSDTLNPGDLVYLYPTAPGRGVQASGTKAIGVYQGKAVTGGPSTAYTEVEVYFGHRYPGDTLVF